MAFHAESVSDRHQFHSLPVPHCEFARAHRTSWGGGAGLLVRTPVLTTGSGAKGFALGEICQPEAVRMRTATSSDARDVADLVARAFFREPATRP